jgi:hypothetical protein
MPEIGTSGSMSGDGKRGVAEWPKLPRPSSTLPNAKCRNVCFHAAVGEFPSRPRRGDRSERPVNEDAHRHPSLRKHGRASALIASFNLE